MYNYTNLTNANNLFTMVKAVNELSDGLFGIFLLATIFLMLYMSFKVRDDDAPEVLLFSSMVTSILGMMLWTTGIIHYTILWMVFGITFGAIIYYWFKS